MDSSLPQKTQGATNDTYPPPPQEMVADAPPPQAYPPQESGAYPEPYPQGPGATNDTYPPPPQEMVADAPPPQAYPPQEGGAYPEPYPQGFGFIQQPPPAYQQTAYPQGIFKTCVITSELYIYFRPQQSLLHTPYTL